MLVGVPLQRELSIRLLDFLLRRVSLHTQYLVVVLFLAPLLRGLRLVQLIKQLHSQQFHATYLLVLSIIL